MPQTSWNPLKSNTQSGLKTACASSCCNSQPDNRSVDRLLVTREAC